MVYHSLIIGNPPIIACSRFGHPPIIALLPFGVGCNVCTDFRDSLDNTFALKEYNDLIAYLDQQIDKDLIFLNFLFKAVNSLRHDFKAVNSLCHDFKSWQREFMALNKKWKK